MSSDFMYTIGAVLYPVFLCLVLFGAILYAAVSSQNSKKVKKETEERLKRMKERGSIR